MLCQINIKTSIAAFFINAVQEFLRTGLYGQDYVNVASFPTAFDGELIPEITSEY
jgi:hypothetical protein